MSTSEGSPGESNSVRSRLPALRTFFSRKWWWTTLLVLVGVGVLLRLGFWQLDRREQRRARNAAILQQLALSPLALGGDDLTELAAAALPANLTELKNRQATAAGKYDLSQQVALTHQNWSSAPGFRLITPLVLDDGGLSAEGRPTAVLVDRGWLPAAALPQEHWSLYDVTGPVSVTGYFKLSQTVAGYDASQISSAPQSEWYRVDIGAIQGQMPYELLPVYLQEAPPLEGDSDLPFRSELDNDLSEGNHLSYAIQWFIFATILAVGYVFFVGKKSGQ